MLYDPKWNEQVVTKPDTSLESFIAWLDKQPRDGIYYYYDHHNCATGLWLRSMGMEPVLNIWQELGPKHWLAAATLPHTFGGALDRARIEPWS